MHQYSSHDFILSCRQRFPNDRFWRISNEFTRQKNKWLQNPVIQRQVKN